ncbi:methylated-DNA--[protein]-cysteine S-methyltransferase [Criblamydia sequanensis]|uniref:methylated-DNA--[protein]-cysteine S-methyltransferase n=1 Tax=Candidatus Criblamydia sequanensis CRIB-18 TaxID=1437425 RepID=A0A090E3V7_9BACT|nr:methylated-DNA--[protein]-cysteine S-methyltransferase [Criblamydia sequanensis]CDR35219.1 Methylated-DNA--protein-cysteinemethyltransferase [Criblamydia sequanensis CRIB-18]
MFIEDKKLFDEIVGKNKLKNPSRNLTGALIDTKIGPLLAIGDDQFLYFLDFINRKEIEKKVFIFQMKNNFAVSYGVNKAIDSIEKELSLYFQGRLKDFKTPLCPSGTDFQKMVWKELSKIPYGTTLSYAELAVSLNKPNAFRACANANGVNQIAIVIPCHRVIQSNGGLGGYSSGISKKKWLLELEKNYS